MTPGDAESNRNRVKRRHKKTNTGCISCRRRRLKCDETKPACMRCLALSQTCEGYQNSETISSPGDNWPSRRASITQVMTPTGPDDPWEQWALNFFSQRTAPKLTGFTSFTKTFWNSVVPQLAQTQPAVRAITIAVAAAHEEREPTSEVMPDCTSIATKHNSRAIQELTQPASQLSTDTVLVCCIAFIAFERLHNWGRLNHERYLDHVVAGSKILDADTARSNEQNHRAFNPIDALVGPMFFQIMLVFSMFRQPHGLVKSFDTTKVDEISAPVLPDRFSDVRSAQRSFSSILWWRYYLMLPGEEPWSSTSSAYFTVSTLLEKWYSAFTSYIQSLPTNDKTDRQNAIGLLEQAQPLAGAVHYSVREDVLDSIDCFPVAVELGCRSHLSIWIQIAKKRKVNLNGMNTRRSLSGDGEVWLWPKAKRIRGPGESDFVLLQFQP